MDEIDKKIIELLKKDPKATNAKLGKAVSLSEAAVRRRVSNLEATGEIKFTVLTKEEASPIMALVFVGSETGTAAKKLFADMQHINGLLHIYELAGDYDVCVVLGGGSIDSLNSKIDEVRSIKGVKRTKTQIILKRWL